MSRIGILARWIGSQWLAAAYVGAVSMLLAGAVIGGAVLAGKEVVGLAYGPEYLLARELIIWLFWRSLSFCRAIS